MNFTKFLSIFSWNTSVGIFLSLDVFMGVLFEIFQRKYSFEHFRTASYLYSPVNIYLFKFSNRNFGKRCEIGSQIYTSISSFWCLYCLLWTYFTPFSSASIVDFEQVNVCFVVNLSDVAIPYWKFQKICQNNRMVFVFMLISRPTPQMACCCHWHCWRCPVVLIIRFGRNSHLFLVFILLTFNK